jgi:hypothetical protein
MGVNLARSSALVLLVLFTGLLAGCGGKKTGTVSGKITVKGKAPNIDGLQITFVGEDGRIASGSVSPEGTYTVSGVPVGVCKVGLPVQSSAQAKAPPDRTDDGTVDHKALAKWEAEQKAAAAKEAKSSSVPQKLRDPLTSGLVVTVVSGETATFDYDIK